MTVHMTTAPIDPTRPVLPAEPAPLYPPTIEPPRDALPVWRFLPTFVRNPLRTLPLPVYHEPMFVPPGMAGRVAWVTDPKLIEEILLGRHDSFPKSPIEKRVFGPVLGDGILLAEGQCWKWQRRITAPLFRHGDLMKLVPDMSAAATRLLDRWRGMSPGRSRRIDPDMTDVTFDVLRATLFDGASDAEAEMLKAQSAIYLENTSWDIAYEIMGLPNWVWHPGRRAMTRSAKLMAEMGLSVVARARTAGWPGDGLMARLGRACDPETGKSMGDAQILNNLLTFAAAGHETTAQALTWALYLLARAPDWQQKVRQEVVRVAGHGPIEPQHVEALSITRQVMKEVMRLYPPAPVLTRMTREETTIGGHTLPAGAMLVIPIYVVHRHRKLWDDPDRFDPTRFTPEREKQYARAQFMPFGAGPRTCIGMGFAMIEAVVLLAMLVRDAAFSCDAALAPEPLSRVTLRPKGGMPLSVDMLSH